MEKIRWGVLGTAGIARDCSIPGMQKAENCERYGIAGRSLKKAEDYKDMFGFEKAYEGYEALLSDPKVQAVYIPLPNNLHYEWVKKAIAAGKHVLCEKSITLNSGELEEAVQLAKEHGVVLAEAMTIYHMPIYKELKKRMDAGKFGELRVIQMNFGSYKEYDMKNRFFNRNLAGGALLDIGVYALSFVRMFLNSCPDQITSQVKLAPTGVDEQAGILLMNREQEMATVTLSLHAKQPKRGMISFDKAYVEMYEYPRGQKAVITYTEDGHTEEIVAGATADALGYEVEDMEQAIAGHPELMKLELTEDVMKMMTRIRKDWGLTYPEEEHATEKI